MSDLFNIPGKDQCGVYTITNRRTGKKYIGSSTQLKKRAEVHKGEIARGKHNNRSIPHSQAARRTKFYFMRSRIKLKGGKNDKI